MNSRRRLAAVAGAVLLPALLLSRTASADESSTIGPGTWQMHKYSFAYMGFTSTYSCIGLADKLKLLLITAGARKDVKSLAGACARGFGSPDKFARADLTFYTLTPGGPDMGSGNKPVNGQWRPVTFAAHTPRDLATGDCELVEQFLHSVLPMFTTRNVDDHTTCVPYQESGSAISVRFESFAAMPGAAPQPSPKPGGI
jgi:hypothetical protein